MEEKNNLKNEQKRINAVFNDKSTLIKLNMAGKLNLFKFSYLFKQKLIRNSLIYTGFSFLEKAIPFLLLPVLTRYLSPAEYGYLITFQIIQAIMITLISVNTHSAVSIAFFKLDREKLKVYIGNVLFIISTIFIFTLSYSFLFKKNISFLIDLPEKWIIYIAPIAFFQTLFGLNISLWQVEQKPLPYALLTFLNTSLNIGLSLIFVILFKWNWEGCIIALIITSSILGVISIFDIYKRDYIKFTMNRDYINDALNFGIPLIPHTLGHWIMMAMDRLLINSMISVAATGIYTSAYQIAAVIGLLANGFNLAWSPFLYEKLNMNKYSVKLKIIKFTYLYFIGITIISFIFGVFAPYLIKLFLGKNYQSASGYILWLSLSFGALGMYYMVVNYIFYIKKTYILAWISLICGGLNVGITYFMIKISGLVGAAQAQAISFLIYFILTWLISIKVYKMPWFFQKESSSD